MRRIRTLSKISVISFIAAQCFNPLVSHAAGFMLYEMSPSMQGDAMAGAAAAGNDVTAMFINPATLGTLTENQAYLGASEIFPEIKMNSASAVHTVNIPGLPPSSISAPVQGISTQGNISIPAFVPDAFVGWRYNNNLVFGVAFVAPFGLATNYHRNSVVRFMSRNTSVRAVDINPAVAYQYNDQWSFGAGFQAQYLKASFENMDGPYTGIPAIDSLIAANHPTHLHGNSWGYGYNLGILWKPDLCTRIGLGFRSQVSEQLSGEGEQYVMPGPTVPAPSPDFLFNGDTNVYSGIKTPGVISLGAARDMQDWTVKGTLQYNLWYTFDHLSIDMPQAFATNVTIKTRWQNSWFASLGADYRYDCAWTFRGGVAYDQTPTRDTYRDSRIPDSDRYWLTLGASYRYTKRFSFDAAYEHLFMISQNINVTQASGVSATSTLPLEVNQVQASYTGHADIVALGVRYSF